MNLTNENITILLYMLRKEKLIGESREVFEKVGNVKEKLLKMLQEKIR